MAEEFAGIYQSTRWVSPDSTYVIGVCEDGSTVKGPAEPGELIPNLPYRFFGQWKQPAPNGSNSKYGPAFHFICAVRDLPHSREAVVQYLLRAVRGHNTSIGHSTAHRLYDLYQSDAVRKLRMEPTAVADAIGLDHEKARRAAAVLDLDAKIENTKIELVDLFANKGFPRTAIQQCIDRWKARAPAMIRKDAFLLLTNKIKGAGFSRCDALYLSLGGNPAKLKRQALCAWHGIQQASSTNGHTWHHIDTAIQAIREKICGVDCRPNRAIKLARRSRWLRVVRTSVDNHPWVATTQAAEAEARVVKYVRRLCQQPPTWPAASEAEASLTPHQKEKLEIATAGRLAILAGSPGTGKTFTAAALIQSIVARHGEGSVAVCAPTGKAAVRITESLEQYNLDLQAKTIHRLLCPQNAEQGHATGEWGFYYGESERLPEDWIVVDEASMIDVSLMASLLAACKSTAHILLIGDPYQLPPVGHGAPLRDLIAAGIPCGELSEIKRNGGQIVYACRDIKDGKPFTACRQFQASKPEDNLLLVPCVTTAQVFAELNKIYAAAIRSPRRDAVEDIQVLVPLNEKSEIGRTKINTYIQQLLNPTGKAAPGGGAKNRYRVGDKVICLSNGKYTVNVASGSGSNFSRFGGRNTSKQKPQPATADVFNGEQGRVLDVADDFTVFLFPDVGGCGERKIRIATKGEDKDSFDLAYAITGHKSQGSEWPIVIVIGDPSGAANRVASREWWYTAISRASQRCVILGSKAVVERQCKRVTLRDRKTFLKELIEREREKEVELQSQKIEV